MRGFYPGFSRDMARRRIKEAEDVRADLLLTDCLSCRHNLAQGVSRKQNIRVMTTFEYLLQEIRAGRVRYDRKGKATS